MRLVQHYNDLTEINQLRSYGLGGNPLANLQALEKEIKTRIAFTDVKDSYGDSVELMNRAGWTIARRTRDWHRVHCGDSAMSLYYKIFPNNTSDPADKRKRAQSTYPCHHSLSGSCSMGLIDNLEKDWLQSPKFPERYLTLVRLPLSSERKRTREEIAKMRYFRYRQVFKSDVARYFANGWYPDEYPKDAEASFYGQAISREFEEKFWASPESPKIDGFKFEPASK
jgi:hypothetical protein